MKLVGTESIRIIIRNPDSKSFIDHIADTGIKETEKNQIRTAIRYWTKAITAARVASGTIALYDFDPSFFLCIVNRDYALYGLLSPTTHEWGFDVKDAFVVSSEHAVGAALIANFLTWFEAVLSGKSVRVQLNGNP